MSYGDTPYGALSLGSPVLAGASALIPRRLILLSPRTIDAATVTAASQVPTLPVTNLQNVQPRKVYRCLDGLASITVAMTPKACNSLALIGGNPSSSRWVRLRAATTLLDLTAAPAIDTDWLSPWPTGARPVAPDWPSWLQVIHWDNDDAFGFWRIDVTDAEVSYIDIGRLMIDRLWQPATNFDFEGTPVAFDPRDAFAETDYGFTFTDRRTASPPRLFSVKLSAAGQADVLNGLLEIQRLAGLAGDVVCCLDPGDTDNFHMLSMQGRFTKGGTYGLPALWDAAGQCWSASIEMREFL